MLKLDVSELSKRDSYESLSKLIKAVKYYILLNVREKERARIKMGALE